MTRTVVDKDGDVYINHDGIETKTDKAVLYNIHGEKFWIPKSQIIEDNGETLVLPQWLAEKNGLESDW